MRAVCDHDHQQFTTHPKKTRTLINSAHKFNLTVTNSQHAPSSHLMIFMRLTETRRCWRGQHAFICIIRISPRKNTFIYNAHVKPPHFKPTRVRACRSCVLARFFLLCVRAIHIMYFSCEFAVQHHHHGRQRCRAASSSPFQIPHPNTKNASNHMCCSRV